MAILITGGTGFIGSTLAEKLLEFNEDIILLDWKEQKEHTKKFIEKVKFIKIDVRDKDIERIFKENEIEGIIHLAAVSRVITGEKNPELCNSINIDGYKNILNNASLMKNKPWFIFGSSREVYGEAKTLPVTEDTPFSIINIYGNTKKIGEELIKTYSLNQSKGITLRFSNVYGNKRDIMDRVTPIFILSALKGKKLYIHGGTQSFDFTHIDDTVNGIIKAIKHLRKQNESYYDYFHLLYGKSTTLHEVTRIISKELNKELVVDVIKGRDYDVDDFYGDPKKAKDILGFEAKISPEEGIKRTISLYRELI